MRTTPKCNPRQCSKSGDRAGVFVHVLLNNFLNQDSAYLADSAKMQFHAICALPVNTLSDGPVHAYSKCKNPQSFWVDTQHGTNLVKWSLRMYCLELHFRFSMRFDSNGMVHFLSINAQGVHHTELVYFPAAWSANSRIGPFVRLMVHYLGSRDYLIVNFLVAGWVSFHFQPPLTSLQSIVKFWRYDDMVIMVIWCDDFKAAIIVRRKSLRMEDLRYL